MIKHIIFGTGQAPVSYVGDLICQKCIEDEQERKEVSIPVFVSPGWILLDMGVIPGEEALKKMQDRSDMEYERDTAA